MNNLEKYIIDLNPIAWFDANNINGLGVEQPNDGDNIGTWKNLGNNYPDFSKINASRFPILKTDIQNGNSGVLFTRGSSTTAVDADHLEAISSLPSIPFPFTLVTVSKPRNLNGNTNGVFVNGGSGGITYQNNEYNLDGDGQSLGNNFRKNNYLIDTTFCIGIRYPVGLVEKIKLGDGEYQKGIMVVQRGLPNQIGGRYTDYASNFQIWNPRGFDGWIFETMLFADDITLNPSREKKLQTYLKIKYNI